MDYRYLGRSGFRVPALSLGTSKFNRLDFVMKGGEVIGAVRLAALVLLLS
jgi:aryl-alcohol dehydrogenase-like predicted oxidoreductase